MSKLYDRDKKDWFNIPDDQVTEKVASGKFAFAQGQKIPVVSPDG